MAYVPCFPYQSIDPQQRTHGVHYWPSRNEDSLQSYDPSHLYTQDTLSYMLTLPTPLVSIPLQQPTGHMVPLVQAAHEARPEVAEEGGYVPKVTDDQPWNIGRETQYPPSDVKWTGCVEHPESCERSSIAREAEHENNLRSAYEQGSKVKR